MPTMRIPTGALSDHMSRLYIGSYHSGIKYAEIETIKVGTKSTIVNITAEAVEDLISDLEYQIEFCEWNRAQNRYALKAIKKQIGE